MLTNTQTTIDTYEAAQELLARRRARQSLLGFTVYTMPEYEVNWHHEVTCKWLDRWIAGDIKRLIVCQPPRNGKTELASKRAPAYIFGRDPDAKIIATSYSAGLAELINRDVQRIIDSALYRNVFPRVRLNDANVRTVAQGQYLRNSDIFEIVGYKGTYRSAGIGGAIVGLGGKYVIIDDPIKNAEEAYSEVYRDKLWEWYRTTLYTRLEKDARVLLILTRWHEDDLAGKLLAMCDPKHESYDPDADVWEVLSLPAILEPIDPKEPWYYQKSNDDPRNYGDPLWPTKYPRSVLRTIQATLLDDWYPIQQQRPQKPGGSLFQAVWFKVLDQLPKPTNAYVFLRYWDKAATEGGGKYTVGTLICTDFTTGYYIVDVARKQLGSTEREQFIKDTAATDTQIYGHVIIFFEREPGSSGVDSAQASILFLAGYEVYADIVTGAKETRAKPLAVQAKAGNIYLIRGEWDLAGWLRRIAAFPKGTYLDEADSASGGFNRLALGWKSDQTETIVHEEQYEISPV